MLSLWCGISLLIIVGMIFILKPLFFYQNQLTRFNSENLHCHRPYFTACFLVLLIPLMSGLLYFYWGNGHQVVEWLATKKRSEQVKQQIAKMGSREKIISTLRTKLQQLPANEESAKGWYLLGKLYLNEKKIPEAIQSFQKAVALKPQQSDYLLDYLSAKFYWQRQLSKEDKQLLNKVLTLTPNNLNAINLLALDAYQQGNFSEAVRHWESLLRYFPPESEDAKNLLAMIHQAQIQLPVSEQAVGKKIAVNVNLSSVFQHKIKPNDVVFVYALEEGDNKIPVAVMRLTADRLPAVITLDSGQSMIPGRSLANVEKVYVHARISKTGNPLPSEGDLIGSSPLVDLTFKPNNVVITINQEITRTN